MYGQTRMMRGCGGLGPMQFGGGALCWGRVVTFHVHRSAGICQIRCINLARQYIALPSSWLRLRMESSVSRNLRSHVSQIWGSSGSSSLVYVSGSRLCGGGGGRSRRGGGSRCRLPPRCQLVHGSGCR